MKSFTPTKNRTALISNEVLEVNRYKLKLNAQKLLIGLAQSIDHTGSLFDELEVDINGVWSFLGIENRNDRYEVVRDALFDITKNPLQERVSKKKWSSIPWMSVKYDESESTFIKIKFHDDAKPYLLNLKEYTKISGGYIAKLSSSYATWLYPIFKMIQTKYHGTHEISIDRLKELTFTDNPKEHPAYNTSKAATKDFLTNVIGVRMNRKSKQIEILKDSPLHEINEKTDIAVNVVKFTKDKQRYKGLIFHVTSKTAAKKKLKQEADKSEYVSMIPKSEILDIGARFPMKQVFSDAKAANMTVQEYLDLGGYFQKGNYAYKKLSDQEYKRLMKEREKKEQKRGYKQITLEEGIEEVMSKRQADGE